MPTQLSQSFTLEEMVFSQTAERMGIANVPDANQIRALRALCINVLQPLREKLGLPIVVSSGFRSAALNQAVGGAPDSQHLTGQAADLQCFSLSIAEFFKRTLTANLPFDQLIYEGGRQAGWVHVSYNVAHTRGDILRATFPAVGDQAATLVA